MCSLQRVPNDFLFRYADGNFASMRRQLSAYKFMRESGTTGYWYHPRFHRKSTYEDLLVIQKGRRRRSKFKEKVHKSKSLNVFKPKPAPVPRNFLNGPGPLANVDINANHAHKPHKQGSTFPEILSEMLNKLSLWSEDGKAFFINRSMFEEHSKTVSVFFSRKFQLPPLHSLSLRV